MNDSTVMAEDEPLCDYRLDITMEELNGTMNCKYDIGTLTGDRISRSAACVHPPVTSGLAMPMDHDRQTSW
jgi:hypothetical protein